MVEWLWTSPLGIGISATVIGGLVLSVILGLPRKIMSWWSGRAPTTSRRSRDRAELLRSVLDTMTMAVSYIEEVWRAQAPLRSDADKLALRVQSRAHELRDDEARRLVLAWTAAYDRAPRAYGDGGSPEAAAMRQAYRNAAAKLGELLRH